MTPMDHLWSNPQPEKAISFIEILGAAVCALVGERCRPSYLHDMRGELHTLNSAVELLARAAKSPEANSAIVEKASSIARHSLVKQEKLLVELVNQLTPQREAPMDVNVGDLVSDVLRFVRNEAAKKSITFRSELARDVVVLAEPHKFRLLILGLCSTLTDGLPAGTVIDVTVTRSDLSALMEFGPIVPCASVRPPSDLLHYAPEKTSTYELLLSLLRQWVSDNAGAIELSPVSHLPKALRLFYPMPAQTAGAGP